MPIEDDENGNWVYTSPEKDKIELLLEDFSKQIQDTIDYGVDRGDILTMTEQMRVIDLMFRAIAVKASRHNTVEYYQAAIDAQKAYRRTAIAVKALSAMPTPPVLIDE